MAERIVRCWRWAMALALVCAPAAAQAADADIDKEAISLGERLTLTVTVLHEPGGRIEWPQPEDGRLGDFEVLGQRLLEPVREGERLASRKEYILTAFQLGEVELPPLRVELIPPGQSRGEVMETEPMQVSVSELGADPQGELRDIKPPEEIPLDWWRVALWVALGAAALALAWWLYRRWRGRPRPEGAEAPAAPPEPRLPPHVAAYQALDELEASPLLEQGRIKEYHSRAAEVIWRYLRGRYGIDAPEMTTRDILEALRRRRLGMEAMRLFSLFFERCDMVKFAKLRPAPEVNSKLVPLARQIVDATKESETENRRAAVGAASDPGARLPAPDAQP